MQGEKYYIVDFKNPSVDESVQFMVMGLEEGKSLAPYIRYLLGARPQLVIDPDKKYPSYPSRHEAENAKKKLVEQANAINPDRVDAGQHFPDKPAQILDAGAPTL